MPKFDSFDTRGYRTLPPREGYARWAPTYEATVKQGIDRWLLERVATVEWAAVRRAVDLGCGTGRTGEWLASRGVRAIDGVDVTTAMLERARARGTFARLSLADVADTGLAAGTYDLITSVLVDEHLERLDPLYREAARLGSTGSALVIVGIHPFFLMKSGMPTHFDDETGAPLAIETHVHLFAEHAQAALAAGWSLAEMHEQVVDERWISQKPSWAELRDVPLSFAFVWRRLRTGRLAAA
jgi:SAM-dependent methyltransferase